jgi:hypothetical protein
LSCAFCSYFHHPPMANDASQPDNKDRLRTDLTPASVWSCDRAPDASPRTIDSRSFELHVHQPPRDVERWGYWRLPRSGLGERGELRHQAVAKRTPLSRYGVQISVVGASGNYESGWTGRSRLGSFARAKAYETSIASRISSSGISPSNLNEFQPDRPKYGMTDAHSG